MYNCNILLISLKKTIHFYSQLFYSFHSEILFQVISKHEYQQCAQVFRLLSVGSENIAECIEVFFKNALDSYIMNLESYLNNCRFYYLNEY